ncbi:MAG TPA: hypothetical protein VFG05_08895 [Methylocella sp.]|nr:hypothetical protein [Methylocella sp.]
MADYYPLLAKAVAGLSESTPEARRAIYERARNALFGQLRNLDPPIPEEAIEREAQALEVAIAQIETEMAPQTPAELALPPGELELLALSRKSGGSSSAPLPDAKEAPEPGREPSPAPRTRRLRGEPKEGGAAHAPPPAPKLGSAGDPADRPGVRARIEGASPAKNGASAGVPAGELLPGSAGSSGFPARSEAGAGHPFPPQPEDESVRNKRLAVMGGITGLLVFAVASAAYMLRDRPEDLMRAQHAQPAQGEAGKSGKIADRIGGSESFPQAPAGASKAQARRANGGNEAGLTNESPPPPALANTRRAALLVAAPEEQTKVKTLLGAVAWRTSNVSGGPDEPLRTAVQAEVEIPDEKLLATVTLQKNYDRTLPASHTVKIVFTVPSGSPLANIKQITGLQMREENTRTGDPLAGVTVPIMANSFLIGLEKGNAETLNLELLRSRQWLDIPIVLADGRVAKLTFEKGLAGQRAIEEAAASWQAQP